MSLMIAKTTAYESPISNRFRIQSLNDDSQDWLQFGTEREQTENKESVKMKTSENLDSYSSLSAQSIDPTKLKHWYAVYSRSRYEKVVAKQLDERDVEHFLPLVPKLRYWKDRKKTVEMPIFPGYIFVNINLKDRLSVLTADGVVRFIAFNGKPSEIPSEQIEDVRRLLKYPDRVEMAPYFVNGDLVEITTGPFAGIRGKVIQSRGKERLLVGIDIVQQAISVEVDSAWLRRRARKEAVHN